LYPTSFSQSVHKLWWSAFETLTASAPLIDLLGGLLAGLIIGLPLWVLFVHSAKSGIDAKVSAESTV
jgi:hypothetical protein